MAAAIMQPLTPDEDMQTTAPDGGSMVALAESFIAPNSRLTSFERLEIYNRQYWFRVLGALEEDFPALRAVTGRQSFDALCVAYLTANPSRSFSLRNLGSKLPDWLTAHPEMAGRRHRLAVDVARIEWAFVEAFDSAAYPPLTLDQIAALDDGLRLALQPHIQLMTLGYPAEDLVLELHRRERRQASEAGVRSEKESDAPAELPWPRKRSTWIAAHRVDLVVYYRRLEREEYETLEAIRRGVPLNEAIQSGFAHSRLAASRRPERVREWFTNWAALGWIWMDLRPGT
jgi:hypothetical protein